MTHCQQRLREELIRRSAAATIRRYLQALQACEHAHGHGKGGHARDVPLGPTLLAALRAYYRWRRPTTYLFPGRVQGRRVDTPLTTKSF